MLNKIIDKIRRDNFLGLIKAILRRVKSPRLNSFSKLKPYFKDKFGFEIGGPSQVFDTRGVFPVYLLGYLIDNCNFSSETTWEGSIQEGDTFVFSKSKKPGRQYVGEASDLHFIKSDNYDFVLSSHALEHIANPLKALFEWKRVLKDEGVLVLVLPHRDGSFDHKREVTSFEHILSDYQDNTKEDDLTHLEEIIEFHDYEMTPEIVSKDYFRKRSGSNFENRCLHHHVFDTELGIKLVDFLGLEIQAVDSFLPHNILIVAKKLPLEFKPNNHDFLLSGEYQKSSPFKTDLLD